MQLDMNPQQYIGNTQRRDFGGKIILIKMLTASLITVYWPFETFAAYRQIKTTGFHYHVPQRVMGWGWEAAAEIRNSHRLRKLRRLVVDIGHSKAHGSRAGARHLTLIHRHHYEFIQVVGPLIIQRACWEYSAMGWNYEIWTKHVVCDLCILLRIAIAGWYCKRERNTEGGC